MVPIGGGLISGVATAAAGRARVIGVEPESSAALHSALAAGERVNVDPTSIADGLNAPYAGRHALSVAREHVEEIVLVSEEEIEDGFRFLYERAKLACEPAGAVAVAAVLAGKIGGGRTVCIVSGGTSPPRRPLLSWPADEDRHPSRLRHRARDVLVRQRVLDALDEGRASRRDLRRVSPFYTGKQKLVDTGGRVERFQRRLEPARAAAATTSRNMAVSYGGQAVLEGVMMRSPSSWAVAIRTPDGDITEVVRTSARRCSAARSGGSR